MNLSEKYRPRDWDQVIGNEKAVSRLQRLEAAGRLGGRAYWIVGASGIGKTTIAEIIARKLADEHNILRIMPGELTMSVLSDIRRAMPMRCLGVKPGKVVIVNEAHGLRKDVIRGMKDVLEQIPEHVTIIFTTTREESSNLFDDDSGEDAGPFRDRCTVVSLTNQGLAKAFAERAREIARAESLDGKPIERYVKLLQDCKNSMRAALNRIENYEMAD